MGQDLAHLIAETRLRAVADEQDAQESLVGALAVLLELLERAADIDEPAAGNDRNVGHRRRLAGLEVDERNALVLPGLAEVELQEGPGVASGHGHAGNASVDGGRDQARRIAAFAGNACGVDRVQIADRERPFAAGGLGAGDEEVPSEDVALGRVKRCAERLDQPR